MRPKRGNIESEGVWAPREGLVACREGGLVEPWNPYEDPGREIEELGFTVAVTVTPVSSIATERR